MTAPTLRGMSSHMDTLYLFAACAAIIGGAVLEAVIRRRARARLGPEPPAALASLYTSDQWKKLVAYTRAKAKAAAVQDAVSAGVVLAFLLAGGVGWVDALAGELVGSGAASLAGTHTNALPSVLPGASLALGDQLSRGLVFLGLLGLLSSALSLPFAIHSTFVVEERFGFNRTTWRTFLLDRLKWAALAVVLGGPLAAAVIAVFAVAGGQAWLLGWAVVGVFSLGMLWLGPWLLLPLFNTFTPLKEGPLRARITRYALDQGLDVTGLYVMDGSRRSSKGNAFVTGLGHRKRVALLDTLLDMMNDDQALAVLAHETGHSRLGHIPRLVGVSLGKSFLVFLLLGLAIRDPALYEAFGVNAEHAAAGLVCFGLAAAPLTMLLGAAANAFSRRCEYAADAFAARSLDAYFAKYEPTRAPAAGEDGPQGGAGAMAGALKQLITDSLAHPDPPPLAVWAHYSHPPALARLRALSTLDTLVEPDWPDRPGALQGPHKVDSQARGDGGAPVPPAP